MAAAFEAAKAEGNEAFRAQRYEEALEHYARALSSGGAPDQHHLVLSNRAAALLALGRHAEALSDCEAVVAKDPAFLKGYLRMAQALKGLGRLREALDACKKGLAAAGNAASVAGDKKPQGYQELTRLAHALNTELVQRKSAAPANSEQAEELMRDYEELAGDVQNLNAALERKVRDARRIDITLSSLAKLPHEPEPPKTFVPVGRMFVQRPLNGIEADLKARLEKAEKEIE